MASKPIQRAILSVTDKTGIIEFARFLASQNVELYSTGGTARLLRESSISVTEISELTGFPEMMDGRVKTLHPKVYGGILADRDKPEHMLALTEHGMVEIDLVVVNLYAFDRVAVRPGVAPPEVIENIDIGGPSMLRATAKNFRHVVVVCQPWRYSEIMLTMANNNNTVPLATRFSLAREVFELTSNYDGAISEWLKWHTIDGDQLAELPKN